MIKYLLTTVALLLSLQSYSQTYNGPESVEFDYANNRWLVANTSSHQVLARSAAGVLSVFTTLTGSGPYGIEIMGDTLYCCNGNSIKGFSLANGQQVFAITVTGASFLNGITHDNNGNLIATDFSAKNIYKINPSSNSFFPIATSLVQSPNGIIFDAANNRCVFVNWGSNAPIKAIDLSNNNVTTLFNSPHSNIDGIARDGNGNYFVSVWGTNKIYKYDSTFSAAGIPYGTGLSSPADIFYNVLSDTLAVPNSGNNTVSFIGFVATSIKETNNLANDLFIYPNPCNNSCTVKMPFDDGEFQLKIFLSNGKEICNKSYSKGIDFTFSISDFNLRKGFYIVEISRADGVYRSKLIIE